MPTVQSCELPTDALLGKHQDGQALSDGFADCYSTDVAGCVSQAAYIEAFYTTPLFRLERLLLAWFVSRPSTDAQAKQLALGTVSAFAAWSVEGRDAQQLLMADFSGRTKSWLMVRPISDGVASPRTRLYFGSAVLPKRRGKRGAQGMGFLFNALLGFHKCYSRLLLRAAGAKVSASIRADSP